MVNIGKTPNKSKNFENLNLKNVKRLRSKSLLVKDMLRIDTELEISCICPCDQSDTHLLVYLFMQLGGGR